MATKIDMYGVMAEFEDEDDLLVAAQRAHEAGYRAMEAYSPFPIEGLAEAVGAQDRRLPIIVFIGGIVGGAVGFFMQYYSWVYDYPLNVGGRPLNSWPSFIPVTFELTILFAAIAAVFGMLALNGMPEPYHPTFNVPRFQLASRDRFFLCIEATDAQFDREETTEFLESLGALDVSDVEP